MNGTLLIAIVVVLVIIVAVLLLVIYHLYTRHQAGKSGSQELAANLQDEKQRSSIILNSIEDGVILMDKYGAIQLMNPAATTLTGWDAKDAAGLDWSNVITLINEKGEAYEEDKNPFAMALSSDKPLRDNNAVLVSRNKKEQPVALSLTPLRDKNDQIYAAVAVFRDVTQERKEERRRSE